ncbi:PREDICTED: transmembrane channel-like protein 7 [Wasmannia auropunctata]|uniref:transmembrane channel-like protein 7 n=1 Tax=Wasmannia auropunctata TaxID=64793 RepID=UPI0005F000BD|nr:PREDICTED: transmembrane channel-like protein 7 [Wasmannia auropunctata]XP_011707826.1 PREDICTED: transmembrane channel-like protein 7 [Wasmannia auropunctata]
MSGGERKKRGGDRGHGWEEAGAEFYQESYPVVMEADLQQALQRDPSHIATLLPSKKSRVATAKRIRNDTKTTLRRRTSTRSRGTTTSRRMSTNIHDAAVSMLPDLSENLSNEERTWEEIMQIKAMPVCMSQKIQLKNQLQSATKLRLQGFEQLKWQRRKAWQQFRIRMKEAWSKMELWNDSLKKIGGNFGMGIVAYFLFIKWLMYLNLLLFAIIFLLIVLPAIVLEVPESEACTSSNAASVACCSELYRNKTNESSSTITKIVQDGGILEYTLLFYGSYTHKIYESVGANFYYNSPLAYVCAIVGVFVVSLVAIVRSAAKGFRERVVEGEGQFYRYCNLIFGGWDYCINNERSASIKHKALYNEMKAFLESERLEEERRNRTPEEETKLFFMRLFVNLLIVTVLIGCGLLVYYIIDFSFTHLSARLAKDYEIFNLFFEFLPYICIVGLNVAVPFLFRYLVALEHYNPSYVVEVTLYRTMFFRFASLAVLLTSLHALVAGKIPDNECANRQNEQPLCWETFVGQQFFKLYTTDIFIQFFMTFFINFPRSLIARHTENKVLRFVGEQEFDLPKHVLDIFYSQTVCWLGCFFAPLLPMVAVIGTFLLFYIKKFTCLVNSTPSNRIYRASRSNCLFMFNLLLSFVLAMIPVGYAIAAIMPSKSCGPFRGLESVWSLLVAQFSQFPNWLQSTLCFLGTAAFGVPAFVILSLLLYYYYVMGLANKHMVTVLKNQLVLEGHDKQFLLNRLSAFIKQQQDQNKFHQEQANDTFQHV